MGVLCKLFCSLMKGQVDPAGYLNTQEHTFMNSNLEFGALSTLPQNHTLFYFKSQRRFRKWGKLLANTDPFFQAMPYFISHPFLNFFMYRHSLCILWIMSTTDSFCWLQRSSVGDSVAPTYFPRSSFSKQSWLKAKLQLCLAHPLEMKSQWELKVNAFGC